MGAFTTVVHEGHDIQFKTGGDNYERYRLGDVVAWEIDPERPLEGKLLDGVYEGCFSEYKDGQTIFFDRLVAIRNHRIVAIVPVEAENESQHTGGRWQIAKLYADLRIEPHPYHAWSVEAWANLAMREAQWRESRRQDTAEAYGKTHEQVAGGAVHRFTRAKLQESGFFRRLFELRSALDERGGGI